MNCLKDLTLEKFSYSVLKFVSIVTNRESLKIEIKEFKIFEIPALKKTEELKQ